MATLTNPLIARYQAKLAALPASGGGGCHPALLGVATLGVMAGVPADDIFRDLREHVHGERVVPDAEIRDAIEKAVHDRASGAETDAGPERPPRLPGPAFDGPAALRRIIEAGRGVGEADLQECSPVRIDWPPEEDAYRALDAIYQPDDWLYIGTRESPAAPGRNLRRAADWIAAFRQRPPGPCQPHIAPNPMSGQPAPKANGKGETFRGDKCVAAFRLAVVEFDNLPHDEQLAFWAAVRLPVVLLVDSGGKSIHGWVRVDGISEAALWTRVVERHLFRNLLQPLGVDPACKNESRLSRLPGHFRTEKQAWQRILYLAPEGKAVAA